MPHFELYLSRTPSFLSKLCPWTHLGLWHPFHRDLGVTEAAGLVFPGLSGQKLALLVVPDQPGTDIFLLSASQKGFQQYRDMRDKAAAKQ